MSDLQPLLETIGRLLPGTELMAYDGSHVCVEQPAASINITSPAVFRRIARAPRGLGLARSYIAGEIVVEGDWRHLAAHEHKLFDPELALAIVRTLPAICASMNRRTNATKTPDLEFTGSRKHSIEDDQAAISYHYDLPVEFYRIMLGPTMVYSSAIFATPQQTLDSAQTNKMNRVCQKLQLSEGDMLLDVGCGWGSLIEHAAKHFGSRGHGITSSKVQYEFCSARSDRHQTFDLGDFRDLRLPTATAVASVGVYEHVGPALSRKFFGTVRQHLVKDGRYLNQSIIRAPGSRNRHIRRNSFVDHYVFPNGELRTLDAQLADLTAMGFTVDNVSFHGGDYARTLNAWYENMERNSDRCAELVGEQRVRVWRAYLAGALQRFVTGEINLAQVLATAA